MEQRSAAGEHTYLSLNSMSLCVCRLRIRCLVCCVLCSCAAWLGFSQSVSQPVSPRALAASCLEGTAQGEKEVWASAGIAGAAQTRGRCRELRQGRGALVSLPAEPAERHTGTGRGTQQREDSARVATPRCSVIQPVSELTCPRSVSLQVALRRSPLAAAMLPKYAGHRRPASQWTESPDSPFLTSQSERSDEGSGSEEQPNFVQPPAAKRAKTGTGATPAAASMAAAAALFSPATAVAATSSPLGELSKALSIGLQSQLQSIALRFGVSSEWHCANSNDSSS
jgi:hypothetical protein